MKPKLIFLANVMFWFLAMFVILAVYVPIPPADVKMIIVTLDQLELVFQLKKKQQRMFPPHEWPE